MGTDHTEGGEVPVFLCSDLWEGRAIQAHQDSDEPKAADEAKDEEEKPAETTEKESEEKEAVKEEECQAIGFIVALLLVVVRKLLVVRPGAPSSVLVPGQGRRMPGHRIPLPICRDVLSLYVFLGGSIDCTTHRISCLSKCL